MDEQSHDNRFRVTLRIIRSRAKRFKMFYADDFGKETGLKNPHMFYEIMDNKELIPTSSSEGDDDQLDIEDTESQIITPSRGTPLN